MNKQAYTLGGLLGRRGVSSGTLTLTGRRIGVSKAGDGTGDHVTGASRIASPAVWSGARICGLLCACVFTLLLFCSQSFAAAPVYKYEQAFSEQLNASLTEGSGAGFVEPFGVTFDAAGNLLVTDPREGVAAGGVVDKFDPSGVFSSQLGVGTLSNFAKDAAVGDASGHVYVADASPATEHDELLVFSAGGELLSRWTGAGTPGGSFGPGAPRYLHVAVDNSSSASKGDVYVTTESNGGEVDVFEPQNGDKEEGKSLRRLEAPEGFAFGEGQAAGAIAVNDSGGPEAGDVFVADREHGVVDRFSSSGEFEVEHQLKVPSANGRGSANAVTVDSATGDVVLIDGEFVGPVVDQFSPAGELLASITQTAPGEPLLEATGVAVQQVGPRKGDVFVAGARRGGVKVFAQEVPGKPTIESSGVADVSGDAASFQAEINPRGAATSYTFEYGPCSSPTDCASSPFTTQAPVPAGSVGAESDFTTDTVPAAHVQGLAAGTTYHFLLIAHNVQGEATGEEHTFRTQSAAPGSTLPDDRLWELVSPPDKHGGVLGGIHGSGGVVQAASDGDAITVRSEGPTEAEPEGNARGVQVLATRTPGGWSSRDLATPHELETGSGNNAGPEYRGFSEDLFSAVVEPDGPLNPALSPDATEATPFLRTLAGCVEDCYRPLVTGKPGVSDVPLGTVFGEEGPCKEVSGGEVVRPIQCGPQFEGSSPDLSHLILRSGAPLTEGAGREELYEWSDGTLSLVSLLPPNGAGEELPQSSAPGAKKPILGGNTLQTLSVRRDVSDDGRRVFWSANGDLYVRDVLLGKTLQLDATEAGCGSCISGGGEFQIASSDGSHVFFTDERRLTKDAGALEPAPSHGSEPDLYECTLVEHAGTPVCELRDLTPLEGGESQDVRGNVLGASEDGSTVYFVAKGTLGGVPGAQLSPCPDYDLTPSPNLADSSTCNLYAHTGATVKLVARLSALDLHDWSASTRQEQRPVRVSPNGEWVTFMSQRSLTGYDNRDAKSGIKDAEVFVYGNGDVACASCDPTGARPTGLTYRQIQFNPILPAVSGQWLSEGGVAALLPAGTISAENQDGGDLPGYEGRVLSNEGRLYFDAADGLVPEDVNNTGDVYEYEPAGYQNSEGEVRCTTASVTFSEKFGGCVGLISSGTSPDQSSFLDASASGADVFFRSNAKLAPQDVDSSNDIYDAHECTAGSPCTPPAATQPPPCVTEASCKVAPTPQPSIFGAPASATFLGAGNLTPPTTTTKPKTAAQLRAEKLRGALKRCKKDKRKPKRLACERAAHKRYGAKTAGHRTQPEPNAHKGSNRS